MHIILMQTKSFACHINSATKGEAAIFGVVYAFHLPVTYPHTIHSSCSSALQQKLQLIRPAYLIEELHCTTTTAYLRGLSKAVRRAFPSFIGG